MFYDIIFMSFCYFHFTELESLERCVFGRGGVIKARGADTFTITVDSLLNTDRSVLLLVCFIVEKLIILFVSSVL